jgi:RNA polymerase sigma-70 factor (ECF subfamily)
MSRTRGGESGPLSAAQAERLSTLFDTHFDRLYRLARRLAGNRDAALDLVQETYLRAACSPRAVPAGPSAEEAWLVRVLINIRRDQWRKQTVRDRHDRTARTITAEPADVESALVANATVWHALDALSPRRRAIVVMAELEDLPVRSIASLVGISTITVRWHLSRARKELARTLELQQGVVDERSENTAAAHRPAPSRITGA